jgi:hypothetical protein
MQVVAPVRETAAQGLGSAARGLPGTSLQTLMRHLTALVAQKEWGVRLAGLLGIKYVLAARLDQAGALLPAVLPAVLTGLKVCSLCSSIMQIGLSRSWLVVCQKCPSGRMQSRPPHIQDGEDDVRAVSTEALLPSLSLVAQQEGQVTSDIEGALWQTCWACAGACANSACPRV